MRYLNIESLRHSIKMGIVPAGAYLLIFCLLTYPLILRFSTHFFADMGDGLQTVWDIWWVNKAVTDLHQNPWHTTFLHYPQGISLLGHTLNPFNGFLGIVLLKVLTLIETYNSIVLFSFVFGGLTAFWLSYSISGSYWASLTAGGIFTFSQYHFAHAEGHLMLVSLEWVPLFFLFWYNLVTKPNISTAIISGIVLFLVILCDYYYFFYCVLTGIIIMVWYGISGKDLLFLFKKEHIRAFGTFIVISLSTSGILIFYLLMLQFKDPLIGAHDATEFSLDLLAPFIPGGHWRFAHLTEFYWSRLPGNIHESSVYIGLSTIILIIYSWLKKEKSSPRVPSLTLWYVILLFFGIMALGPVLHIGGKPVYAWIMPYKGLQKIFPPIELSGCPVRMMVMVMLGASVISAIGLGMLFRKLNRRRILLGGVLGLLFILDFLPKAIPSSAVPVPEYVYKVKELPKQGGLLDNFIPPWVALYYQTIHEKPLIDGYIARLPNSVYAEMRKKYEVANKLDFLALLSKYDIHYILTDSKLDRYSAGTGMRLLYERDGIRLYKIERQSQ